MNVVSCSQPDLEKVAEGFCLTDERREIEAVLQDPSRVIVEHTYSLHNMVEVEGGVRLHIVLKFKYDAKHIEPIFGARKPEVKMEKRYQDGHRIFPYCIFNSTDEVPLSWTYQNNEGRVCERIELLVTVTDIKYMRYYPFELRLLSLKVGSDGTAKTGLVNLLPEVNTETKEPNVDFGVFTKKTSALQIGPKAIQNKDVICRMVMRDLQQKTLGNLQGLYTRVYTVFFFEARPWENLFKYVVLSTMMVHGTMFCPLLCLANLLSIVLGLVLTEVALLFVMPHNDEFTTAEFVVVSNTLYVQALCFALGFYHVDGELSPWKARPANVTASEWATEAKDMFPFSPMCVASINMIYTAVVVAYVTNQYQQFRALVQTIKGKFGTAHPLVGKYGDIDEQI